MKNYRTASLLILSLFVLLVGFAYAAEPEPPDVDAAFDPATEAEINALAILAPADAFAKLKDVKYSVNERLLNKAVFRAFGHREKESLGIAANYLTLPVFEIIRDKTVNRSSELRIAKKVLEIFYDDAPETIWALYQSGDPVTKGNSVKASGRIASNEIREFLVKALDDKTPVEEGYPEAMGEPIRICDLAYNQLVLRYKIQNVLRTIGTVHKVEDRDYHINVLKGML